jgi:chorismate synthase
MKYGKDVDLRGGGHFSGRLTAPMCIIGGICLQYLASKGIYIGAHLYSVGDIYDTPFDSVCLLKDTLLTSSDFPTLDKNKGDQMKDAIESARLDGDSVGGIVECGIIGLPAGLGEHMFDGVENRISSIVFGIPAVKGIEFGAGFESAKLRGSENNDAFYTDGKNILTKTNNAGGILGGMTSGMPVILRAAVKPTPSIFRQQESVDLETGKNALLTLEGRHDPAIIHRARVVVDSVTALVLCDLLAQRYGTDFIDAH